MVKARTMHVVMRPMIGNDGILLSDGPRRSLRTRLVIRRLFLSYVATVKASGC